MGIEQFFSSIEENNITNLESSFTNKLEKQLVADYLCVDFNSIIYITSFKVVYELNKTLYKIITGSSHEKINDFKSKYSESKVSELILDKIVEYTLNIVTNYLDPTKLQHILIAPDGVPSKSKMLEQKKRRYMGAITAEIKKKIFDKYTDELKKHKSRFIFEQYKIEWSRNNISPGTEFMDSLDTILASESFKDKIREKCSSLKTLKYIGIYEPGEGEKKIVDYIRSAKRDPKKESSYVIYSPDSDVTLLGLLLCCKLSPNDQSHISKLQLLRHNQQKDRYDVVHVDQLSTNIYKYISKKTSGVPDQDRVINDVVFVLTIFGNDFLPKLESFSVRQDFNRIIDKYAEVIKKNKFRYLIETNSNSNSNRSINQSTLVEIVRALQLDEGGNLQKKYMDQHYQNYNKLKKILGADQTNFTTVINMFLNKLRQFHTEVVKQVHNNNLQTVVAKWSSKNEHNFIATLQKLARFDAPKTDDINLFILSYIEHFERYNKFPKIAVTLRRYSKSLEDEHHRKKLEKSLEYLDPNLKITKYDQELYKFENMLDEYTKKLNAYSLNLGYVSVDPNTYSWKTEKIDKGVKRYYAEFFNIRNISISSPEMQKLVHSYLQGLVWVFEYYFNNFNLEENSQVADTWFYEYSHAPLLSQIYEFLKTKTNNSTYIENISQGLLKFKVPRAEFFKTLEHLMYVMPVSLTLEVIPEEYQEFANNHEFYPDFHKIVEKIWSEPTQDIIDCRGALFLTKCNILLEETSFEKDKKFLRELRKIKLSASTASRNK